MCSCIMKRTLNVSDSDRIRLPLIDVDESEDDFWKKVKHKPKRYDLDLTIASMSAPDVDV